MVHRYRSCRCSRRCRKRVDEVEAKPSEVADVAGGEVRGGVGDLGIVPLQWASLTFGGGNDIAPDAGGGVGGQDAILEEPGLQAVAPVEELAAPRGGGVHARPCRSHPR